MRTRIPVSIPLLISLIIVGSALGGEDSLFFLDTDELITTASKEVEPVRTAPGTVTVLTHEELEEMGALTLADALKYINSMEMVPKQLSRSNLFLRGIFNSFNQVILLMIDGRPVNDNFSSSFYADLRTPIDNIKQIEVITGPGSSLYGANAFAGVINIITKTGMEMNAIYTKAGGGTYNTGFVIISAGQEIEGVQTALTLRTLSTDGQSAEKEPSLVDEDLHWHNNEHRDRHFWARIDYEHFSFKCSLFDYKAGLPGVVNFPTPRDEMEVKRYYGDLMFDIELGSSSNLKLRSYIDEGRYTVNQMDEVYDIAKIEDISGLNVFVFGAGAWEEALASYRATGEVDIGDLLKYLESTDPQAALGAYSVTFDTLVKAIENDFPMRAIKQVQRRIAGEVLYSAKFSTKNSFLAGAEYRYDLIDDQPEGDKYASVLGYDAHDAANVAVYIQDKHEFSSRFYLLAGARYDQHSVYSGFFSPRLSAVYYPSSVFTLKLNLGRAFRAPSFVELYSDFQYRTAEVHGNPDLKPEEMRIAEIIGEHNPSPFFSHRMTLFGYEVKNFIQYNNTHTDFFIEYDMGGLDYYILFKDSPFTRVLYQSYFTNNPLRVVHGAEYSLDVRLGRYFDLGLGLWHRRQNFSEEAVRDMEPSEENGYQRYETYYRRFVFTTNGANLKLRFHYKDLLYLLVMSHFSGYNWFDDQPIRQQTKLHSIDFWDSEVHFTDVALGARFRDFHLVGVVKNVFGNKYEMYDDIFDASTPREIVNNQPSLLVMLQYTYHLR